MAKVKLELEVSKEAHELGAGLAAVLVAVKEALADGWQPLTDAPKVVLAAVSKLAPAVNGVDQLDDEFAEDKAAFMKALMLPLADAVALALKKPSA